MPTLRRLANSCLLLETDDHGTTLFDPGFFTWGRHERGEMDLATIGDVQRVLVTHVHADHVEPDFVRWLVDRGDDVTVHANDDVAALLAEHDLEVHGDAPAGTSFEDVTHERLPIGEGPPNRSWTVGDVLTHPGDSYEPTTTAPALALPLMSPWGSITASVAFAKRVGAERVVPIHDFYLSESGRAFAYSLAEKGLGPAGIEVVALDWGEHTTW